MDGVHPEHKNGWSVSRAAQQVPPHVCPVPQNAANIDATLCNVWTVFTQNINADGQCCSSGNLHGTIELENVRGDESSCTRLTQVPPVGAE